MPVILELSRDPHVTSGVRAAVLVLLFTLGRPQDVVTTGRRFHPGRDNSCNCPRKGRQRSRSCGKQAANRPPFHWRPWTTAPTYVPCGRFGPISGNAPVDWAADYDARNLWSPSRTGRCTYVAPRVGFPIWCPPSGRCVLRTTAATQLLHAGISTEELLDLGE